MKSDYEAIFNSLGTAVINYNEAGKLRSANRMANLLIPDLQSKVPTLKIFIDFLYEHSIHSDNEGILETSQFDRTSNTIFSEVINLNEDRFYLVRARTNLDKSVIIEFSDISQVKNNADNIKILNRQNKILVEAIQSLQNGVFIAESNENQKIIFMNQSLCSILGCPIEDVMGESLDVFLSEYFSDEWINIKETISKDGKGRFWRHTIDKKNESQWVLLDLSADLNCGQGKLIIGFLSDETQSKYQESQLLQSQKLEAMGKLAAGIAHDFNNILSIVDGYTQLSKKALKRGEDIDSYFLRIQQAVTRGSGLTKQLLLFGKHRVSENKTIDACFQLQDIKGLLKPLLGADIELMIDIKDCPIHIRATPDSLSQIIMNLAINARDAMQSKGNKIKITLEKVEKDNGHFALFKVVDSGTGIPPEIIGRIFEPFFTTKEQGKGTGLGLSMVYGIVNQLNGIIDVESVLGEGATFSLYIPITELDSHSEVKQELVSNGNELKGKTILIAEDEVDLLQILKLAFEEMGMHVLAAENGIKALEIQDEHEEKIDFLLTDMVMPRMGGLKLATLIKDVRPETRIIFMSGYPVRTENADLKLPDDAIFVAKPIHLDSLRDILMSGLSGKIIQNSKISTWEH